MDTYKTVCGGVSSCFVGSGENLVILYGIFVTISIKKDDFFKITLFNYTRLRFPRGCLVEF